MSVLNRITKAATVIAVAANALGTLVVLALVIVVNYDAIARGAFDRPFMGAVEVVQFSMVLIIFLQLPDVVRVNRLTRSDGFLLLIGKRWPAVARVLRQVLNTIACVFMLLVAITIWPEFLEMLETRDYFGIPGVFTAPWWPIKLVIFLSACLCCLLFSLKALTGQDLPEKSADSIKDI